MYFSGIDQNPDLDLQDQIDNVFDQYPHEFRDFWGLDSTVTPGNLDADDWEARKDLSRLAKRISAVAVTLARPAKLPEGDLQAPAHLRAAAEEAGKHISDLLEQLTSQLPDRADEIAALFSRLRLEEDARYRFFLACLQLELSAFLVDPRDLAERTVELSQYVSRVRGERAIQYLARVSRCYLYGMNAELAVMARSALEALLDHEIPEAQVRAVRRLSSNQRTGLTDYIQVAQGTLLTGDAIRAAWKVKQLGDDAVHVSTETVGDPHEVLENLVLVLKCLESRAG
jgi:hypothetical protein